MSRRAVGGISACSVAKALTAGRTRFKEDVSFCPNKERLTVRCKQSDARTEDSGPGAVFVSLLRLVLKEYIAAVLVVEIDVFNLPAVPSHL